MNGIFTIIFTYTFTLNINNIRWIYTMHGTGMGDAEPEAPMKFLHIAGLTATTPRMITAARGGRVNAGVPHTHIHSHPKR